ELFRVWWEHHRDLPRAVRQLDDNVKQVLDPQGRGRQYLAAQLEKLSGTRLAGFVLTRQAPAGKCGAATYAPDAGGQQVAKGHAVEASDAPDDAHAFPDHPSACRAATGRRVGGGGYERR